MTNNSGVLMSEDGAHASLQTTDGYDYARVKRELDEDHAKIWDLVRRCHAAEESDIPVMAVHRLVAGVGDRCLVALAMDIDEEGWLEHNPTKLKALSEELPNRSVVLHRAANARITIDELASEERPHEAPNAADLLRLMREHHVGRPSTYATNFEKLSEFIEHGYAVRGEDGRYTITSLGKQALTILREHAFRDIGVRQCEELEADLEAIASGRLSRLEVARKHIGFVKTLPRAAHDDAKPAFARETLAKNSALPQTLDPERTLAPNHPLRVAKARIAGVLKKQNAPITNDERSARRAAVAFVVGRRIWKLQSSEATLDELRYNLAYRWACSLAPEDIVWTTDIFQRLVAQVQPLVHELDRALSTGTAPKRSA